MLHKAVRTIYGACPVHVGPASVVWLVREKRAAAVVLGPFRPPPYGDFGVTRHWVRGRLSFDPSPYDG